MWQPPPAQSYHSIAHDINGNGHGDGDEPKKRRRVNPNSGAPRRALSCTECKRRKTRCSSLGVTPCESCVKRGKPQDCRWESTGGPGDPVLDAAGPPPSGVQSLEAHNYALTSDVAQLKNQIQALYAILGQSSSSPLLPSSSSSQSPSIPASAPIPSSAPPATTNFSTASSDADANFENAVTTLEGLVASSNSTSGSRSHSHAGHSPVQPLPNLSTASSTESRLPAMLDKDARPEAVLRDIWAVLPGAKEGRKLAEGYFGGYRGPGKGGWTPLHVPTFRRELEAFCDVAQSEARLTTDPAWLAIYLQVLAYGILSLSPTEAQALFPAYETEDISRLPNSFYQASLLALSVARVEACPQVRHIQVVLLYIPFLFHFGTGQESTNAALSHISAATTACQWLNLDQLGSDSATPNLPLDDPAFEGMSREAAFEMAKRLVGMLGFIDGTSYKRAGIWRLGRELCGPRMTALPRNLNDEDLEGKELPVVDRPLTELTDATLARAGSQFAETIRKFMHPSVTLGYDDILKYDEALSFVLNQFPSPFLVSQPIHWMHSSLFASINNRRLRIHRPHMARGYLEPRYAPSKDACIEAAKNIVLAQRLMAHAPYLRPGFSRRWSLGAALVLMVDLVLSIDLLAPKHILANKRQEVVHALEIFQQPNPLDPVKAETQSCARTITALLAAADRRLSGRDAGEVKGTRGDVQEFFNEVTKSLTTTLPEDVISSTLEWLEANAEHTPPGFDPTGGNNANILPPELSDFDFFSVDMQALLGAPAPTSSTSIQVPLAPVPTEVSVSGLVSTGVQSFDTDLIWGWDQFAADPGMGL